MTSWKEFIRTHMAVLSGMDFFTVEVLTWRGLVTYYVLFVIQLETRRVILAGIARQPTEEGMQRGARNLTDTESRAPQEIYRMCNPPSTDVFVTRKSAGSRCLWPPAGTLAASGSGVPGPNEE